MQLLPRSPFWARQVAVPPTYRQELFDVALGIVAPLLCLAFDPIVFTHTFLGFIKMFAYCAIAVSICALIYSFYDPDNRFNSGVMLAAGVFAWIMGFAILPLTLIGIVIGIGVFGLTPFVTSIVYLRRAQRGWKPASQPAHAMALLSGIVVFALVPAGLHVSANSVTESAIRAIESGSETDAANAASTLRYMRFALDTDRIALAYDETSDATRKQRIAQAYQEITGEDVESRLAIIND